MRFLPPVAFIGAAVMVHFFNASRNDRVLALPFLDQLFPSMARHPQQMGEATVLILGAIGGLMLLRTLLGFAQNRGA